jgi:twitching motility protein PilT
MPALPKIIKELFSLAVANAASDLHLKAGRPAMFRVGGQLVSAEMAPLTEASIKEFIDASLPERFRDRWATAHQIDYSLDCTALELGRYRVNAYVERGQLAVALRLVKAKPPTFAQLNLSIPSIMKEVGQASGLVLVCGPTGSGKSSTIAAILQEVNQQEAKHIITLEDPIEYIFKDEKASFSQREVGIDVTDFSAGLLAALRQDPDIILVGEMRDRDTFETALRAAETGHLVLATLHAGTAQQAVQRLFEFYPPEQLPLAKRNISAGLKAILVQTLVPRSDATGVLPATEVFIVDPLSRRKLADGEFEKVPELVEAGGDFGSRAMNQDLLQMVRSGLVAKSEAMTHSPNPKGLEMNLKGISFQSSRIVS